MSTVTFFPVENGAMTLLKIDAGNCSKTILIDMLLKMDDDGQALANELKDLLLKDYKGRPYVDVLLITHNDKDHVCGAEKYFHLNKLDEYDDDVEDDEKKIVIRELWTSYRFWKRASEGNKLTPDAKALNREMKRRVQAFEDNDVGDCDNAVIFGKHPEGKTDETFCKVYEAGQSFSRWGASFCVLGPLAQMDDEADEEFDEKNRGSVMLSIAVNGNKILLPGDAEVEVWEELWNVHKDNINALKYDILLTPHHTSWHSISHDSRSECDNPKVSPKALNALSQAENYAYIISSSKAIRNDDNDPPCHAAKKKYQEIEKTQFLCTGDSGQAITINLTTRGPQLEPTKNNSITSSIKKSTGTALPHG